MTEFGSLRTSSSVLRRVFLPLLALIALAAIPATASAADHFISIPKVKASKGYKGTIYGGKDSLGISVSHKNGSSAIYMAQKAKVTKKKAAAKLGARGQINLKFKPKGKAKKVKLPKGCKGKAGKLFRGTFSGKVTLKGEQGFTKVKIKKKKKLKGTVLIPTKIKKCKPGKSPKPGPKVATLTVSKPFKSGGATHSASVTVSRPDKSGSKATVDAFAGELYKKYSVFRLVTLSKRPASALTYNDPFTTGTIKPGKKPFSGSATLSGGPFGTPTGSLKVNFPGRKNFAMTGTGSSAYFYVGSGFGVGGGPDAVDPLAEIRDAFESAGVEG